MTYRFAAAAALVAAAFVATPALAQTKMTGEEVIKTIDADNDGTLDIAEVIHAGSKLFAEINPDGDTTLESKETEGRLTKKDWKKANKDGDDTLGGRVAVDPARRETTARSTPRSSTPPPARRSWS
ncbi:hypothetical protein [Chenggangzhangella methanolivorans]|uniref:hypothetical protein n=1 Tax=Chenggangzhangella methanolivorans TaxID=1437009 RepID=UPI0021BD15AD|nr:hypothetical protein [Chenggangzhangella methanolivorans]